jgi:molybdenum cofactor biosynthesis enzyme MoaA
MPLGEVEEDRFDHYLPLTAVRADLERRWTLESDRTAPAAPRAMCAWPKRAGGWASSPADG